MRAGIRFTRSSARAEAQPNARQRGLSVADQAVGRVHRLVGVERGQAAHRQPEGGRRHTVVEAFREALDSGHSNAGLVEANHVAPDDAPHRRPRRAEAPRLQGFGHRLDMLEEASLRQAGNRGGSAKERAEARAPAGSLQHPAERRPAPRRRQHRPHTVQTATGRIVGLEVELPIKRRDEGADPLHRMADAALQRLGIAEGGVEPERQGGLKHRGLWHRGRCRRRLWHGGQGCRAAARRRRRSTAPPARRRVSAPRGSAPRLVRRRR